MTRVAINGFGRIGRCLLRALEERGGESSLELVAINEPSDPEAIAYLTRYDTTHGRFPADVELVDKELRVNDRRIRLLHGQNPSMLPWDEMGVDLVLECSCTFSDRATAERHLQAGASRVLFSQPAEAGVDATIVMGVNSRELRAEHRIVSAASCTTNCVLPPILALEESYGIESGSIRTLHAAMNDQPVIDAYHHRDLRRTRAAFESMIPVETALARGIERVLPEMQGRLEARAMRLPLSDVSAIDLTLWLERPTTVAEVNDLLAKAAQKQFSGIMGYTEEPLVSCDFVHDPHSCVVDGAQTSVARRRLVKLLLWFDNEWGFANRMLDLTHHWNQLIDKKSH